MKTYTVVVSTDTESGDQFVEWLIEQGHDAALGNSTENYIDGACASSDENASMTMNTLWNEYCES